MKVFKNPIFMFILGAIMFSTITAIAINVGADEIQYDSTHTVKDKIDDLYNIATNYKNLSQTTTVASNKMLNGFTAYDNSGNLVTGNIPTYNGTTIFNASYSNQTATTAGKYVADDIVINGMASTYKNLTETTDVTGSALLYNVVAYNSSGQTVTGSIETYSGSTNITPTTSSQTLTTNGKYLSSDITVNAIPSSYKNLSTATTGAADRMLYGYTAYDNDGNLLTGTIQATCIYKSVTISSSASTSTGQKILDFVPTRIIFELVGPSNRYRAGVVDVSTGEFRFANIADKTSASTSNSYSSLSVSDFFRADSSDYYIKGASNSWVGGVMNLVACE